MKPRIRIKPRKKYGNKKTVIDGIQFDSKKEAQRYLELKLLQRAGKIEALELQKDFELIPAQYEEFERYGKNGQRLKDGKRCIERSCVYKADFAYLQDGQLVVEDTKSKATKTPEYIIKRKLLLWRYGIKIIEI